MALCDSCNPASKHSTFPIAIGNRLRERGAAADNKARPPSRNEGQEDNVFVASFPGGAARPYPPEFHLPASGPIISVPHLRLGPGLPLQNQNQSARSMIHVGPTIPLLWAV